MFILKFKGNEIAINISNTGFSIEITNYNCLIECRHIETYLGFLAKNIGGVYYDSQKILEAENINLPVWFNSNDIKDILNRHVPKVINAAIGKKAIIKLQQDKALSQSLELFKSLNHNF